MLPSSSAEAICRYLAWTLHETDQPISLKELIGALPQFSEEQVGNTLERLVAQDILVEIKPGAWQFTSLLFGRWLAVNRILEQHGLN
jgi:hypothetical protein